jgi:hypothetical protein
MDTSQILPGVATAPAAEVDKRAEQFATHVVERLKEFNRDNPEPDLPSEARSRIDESVRKQAPTPDQLHFWFRVAFVRYLASKEIIVP